MRLLSPAKINLFLNVLFKRKDGYHEIATLFERIRLSDRINLTRVPSGIKIKSASRKIPRGPKNLAYQAAKLLKDRFSVKQGVVIDIQKNIPVSAGLGGGSSNAATVLLGLNELWGLGLSKKQLLELAGVLGSDVPFFVLETPFALGRGRGEILKKINPPAGLKLWHCLVKPPFGISTKEAYQSLKLSSLTPKKTDAKILLHSVFRGDSKRLRKLLTNSLEQSLNKRVVKIFEIKAALDKQGALASLMSGSGPSVFGIYRSKKKAAQAARYLRSLRRDWQIFVTSTF